MAIIYTYPTKTTLALADTVLISDSADGNKTKNATVTSIKDAIDVVDSITATLPLEATSSTGDITISSRAYAGGATTGFVPIGGTAGNYLDGAGTWSTIDLTTDVNGILPPANGGLGLGSFQDGDLVYYNGTRFTALATAGVTDNYVLTAASGVPTWAVNPGGGDGPGTGTQYSLPIWSTTSTLGDSLITQDSLGEVVNIGTSIASFSTVAGTGSVFATRLRVNGYSSSGGKLQLDSADGGTSVTLQGPPNSGTTYDLQLPNAVGGPNQVLKLPASPGATNQLVWGDATGGSVSITADNTSTDYVDVQVNPSTITGTGTVMADLNAVDGTSDTTTRFLSKDNTWDVPSYTAASAVSTYTNANNNYILTSSGAGSINGESSLLYNGSILTLATNSTLEGSRFNTENVQTTNGIIELSNSSTSAYGYQCNLDSNSKTTGANKHIIFRYDGAEISYIRNASANSVEFPTGPSDERKKKNIVNWDDKILDSFSLIEPKKFNYLNESDSDELTKGFIAQQMVDKFPEAYPKDPDIGDTIGYYSFNPSGMTVYLMKAVKELKEEIDSLKSRISTLEG